MSFRETKLCRVYIVRNEPLPNGSIRFVQKFRSQTRVVFKGDRITINGYRRHIRSGQLWLDHHQFTGLDELLFRANQSEEVIAVSQIKQLDQYFYNEEVGLN